VDHSQRNYDNCESKISQRQIDDKIVGRIGGSDYTDIGERGRRNKWVDPRSEDERGGNQIRIIEKTNVVWLQNDPPG